MSLSSFTPLFISINIKTHHNTLIINNLNYTIRNYLIINKMKNSQNHHL